MKNLSNIIYGRNVVMEALKSNRVLKLFLVEGFSDSKILNNVNKNIEIKYISLKEMNNICDGVHQNCAAEIKPYEYLDLEGLINLANKKKDPVILMLDGIEDNHNLGAILRCADVFDVTGIIIPKHNQISLNSTVAKTSAGAINYVPVCQVNNLNQAIEKLKAEGYWIVSSDGEGKTFYNELKYDFKTVLIIGSEGFGISKLVLKNSDYVIRIPMLGKVNSLNASVATGILLSYIRNHK